MKKSPSSTAQEQWHTHHVNDSETPVDISPASDDRRSQLLIFLIVFCVALTTRVGFGIYRLASSPDPHQLEFPDEQQYWQMARGLAEGKGLRDELGFQATRMPLYPAFLSLWTEMTSGIIVAKSLQWIIGAMAAILVARIGLTLGDRRTGVIAGLFVAIDPFLVFLSSTLLTETLFITGLAALMWLFVRCMQRTGLLRSVRMWLTISIIAALCIYIRDAGLGLLIVALGWLLIRYRFRRSAILASLAVACLVFLSLIPWWIRNRAVLGGWQLLTTRLGISLYDGVRPDATGASDLGEVKWMPEVRGLSETQWNRHFLKESLSIMLDDPMRIAKLSLVKWGRLWNPIPNVAAYQSPAIRWVAAIWSITVYTFAVAGIRLLPKVKGKDGGCLVVFLLLPALYVTLLHGFFVGSVRYRMIAMPFIEVLAAMAMVEALKIYVRQDRPPKSEPEATG